VRLRPRRRPPQRVQPPVVTASAVTSVGAAAFPRQSRGLDCEVRLRAQRLTFLSLSRGASPYLARDDLLFALLPPGPQCLETRLDGALCALERLLVVTQVVGEVGSEEEGVELESELRGIDT
jgi:hypothetical protein